MAEDVLREINRGGWSTGYCGQSPERIKSHMAHQADFDMRTQKATTGPNKGDYYGLPWPCWGSPAFRHPGTPLLYNTNLSIKEGGGTFRARFGVEREEKLPDGSTRKVSLLGNGYYSKDLRSRTAIRVHLRRAEEARVGQGSHRGRARRDQQDQPDDARRGVVVDRSVRRHPACRDRARMHPVRQRQGAGECLRPAGCDPGPSRADLHAARRTGRRNTRRCRTPSSSVCRTSASTVQKAAVEKGIAKQFPLILSSGRLVEYEGGGEETRSNKWLAELQQDMFIEINPVDAADRGIKDGWMGPGLGRRDAKRQGLPHEGARSPNASARASRGRRSISPAGSRTEDQRGKYPKGADPIVLGESVNTLTTYGYDPVTGMQEPKATLCQIRAA